MAFINLLGKTLSYDSREWGSTKNSILERVCEQLQAGQPIRIREAEALRIRGVGRKTLDELIRRGYVIGPSSDPESRKAHRDKQMAETAARRKQDRAQKVRQMILDTELRLKSLQEELRALTA